MTDTTPIDSNYPPRILIAGQSSGVGKTTITLGLIAALRRRGLIVQPFKCGPDYIDPTYHTLAAGRPCRNLDTWLLTPAQMVATFQRACRGVDIAIIEGVMGLFDGSSYMEETGSSAQIAKLLAAPTLLVLDIGKLARSAGALALGYQHFDPALRLAGFVLNQAGSAGHAEGCASAIAAATGLPTLGWLLKQSPLAIPERHLGLIPTNERSGLADLVTAAADAVAANLDLTRIIALAQAEPLRQLPLMDAAPKATVAGKDIAARYSEQSTPPTLAVARDEAFSFYYPDNLELLAAAGAEIAFFSPLHDPTLPAAATGIYIGGGFPEVYAAQLSNNAALLTAIRRFHAAGHPIYAECGGFMYLTEALVDEAGVRWPLVGIVPGEAHMQPRLVGLGYRLATACRDNLLLRQGATVRGHEFHYSTWSLTPDRLDDRAAWQLRRRADDASVRLDGYASHNLLASYLHIHFGQEETLAARLVAQMCKLARPTAGLGVPSTNQETVSN